MIVLQLIPTLLSFLLLAAHFYRGMAVTNVVVALVLAALCIAAPALLLVRRVWALRLVQVLLVLGSLEWLRTLVAIIEKREAYGEPWTAAAIIMGSVAAFTLLAALVLLFPPLSREYFRGDAGAGPADELTENTTSTH